MSTPLVPPAPPRPAPGPAPTPELLAAARRRLVARAVHRAVVAGWAVLAVVLVAIWWLTTPTGHFWPAWPILGWTVAAVVWGAALSSRHPFVITDAAVAREAARAAGVSQHP